MTDRRSGDTPTVRNAFSAAVRAFTRWMGSASAAVVAVAVVGAWLLVGAVGGFTDRWLALLYVITSASTFVTVFFIQHTADRDSRAISCSSSMSWSGRCPTPATT
jgi:low affinity Fe/Cu permease